MAARQKAEVNEIVGAVAFGMAVASIVVMIIFPILGMTIDTEVPSFLLAIGLLALSIPFLRRRAE